MATDRKITQNTAITGANVDPANDAIEIVDVSDTTDAPSGTNKKIIPSELLSLFSSFFRNALGTFTSIFVNNNTAARTYTFQDRNGTIADVWLDKAKGTTNNRYIVPTEFTSALTTAAAAANIMRFHPFLINTPYTIDTLACEVTTGTSGKIRIGIYADDGTGYPGALMVDSGELTITAPGVYTATVSNVNLKPGLYYIGYITDTANTMRGIGGTSWYNSLSLPNTMGANIGVGYSLAKTYGALPDPFGAGAAVLNSNSYPIMTYRIV